MTQEFDIAAHNKAMAESAANFGGYCLMHVHRGVLDCGDKAVIYGNDGYDDPRAKAEVKIVIDKLRRYDVAEPHLGVSDDGYSWALVVENYRRLELDYDVLQNMVIDAWTAVCDKARRGESQ